ncbi:hypothetical protein LCGC14_0812320 [marine sediment metagenome]|uniref:Uncharacterized protein n=1 Tax=marine sediment metagenome TaxID=412755 RepID=A0A0F9PQW1_9ZZZZ
MDTLKGFSELFVGGSQAHGEWDVNHEARTIREPATTSDYEAHLEGKMGLGLIPIRLDGSCRFGAIDIDINTIDHQGLLREVLRRHLPLSVCRSKSGGAHLYLFIKEPGLMANQVQALLKRWASLLGHPGSEIFPKQVKVNKRSLGNWINLPYFNAKKSIRYALASSGALTIEEFLASIRFFDPDLSDIDETQNTKTSEMPPCLQTLIQIGLPEGQRNQGLFNFAVFYRKSNPNEWEERILQHNSSYVKPPLSYREVQSIIKSVGSIKYQYLCEQEPIASRCNKAVCVTLKYGVSHMPWQEAGSYDEFLCANLRKLLTDPPKYILEVCGHDIILDSEEFFKFPRFRMRVAEILDLMLAPMKQPRWEHNIKKLLATKKDVEAPEDVTQLGHVMVRFQEFLTLRERAQGLEDIIRGIPVTQGDRILFRGSDLRRFLFIHRINMTDMGKVYLMLKEEGCTQVRIRVAGKHLKLWGYPVARVNEQTEDFPKPAGDTKEEL